MKHFLKKAGAIVLTAAMLLGSSLLTACGDRSVGALDNDLSKVEKVTLEHAYQTKYLNTSLDDVMYINNLKACGDKVYMSISYSEDSTSEPESNVYSSRYGSIINLVDIESGTLTELFRLVNENTSSPNGYDGTSYDSITPAADGTFWCTYSKSHERYGENGDDYVYENSVVLQHLNNDGSLIAEIPTDFLTQEYDYINGIIPDMNDGQVLIRASSGYYLITPEGELVKQVVLEDDTGYFGNAIVLSDGTMICIFEQCNEMDYTSTRTFKRIDFNSGKLEDLGEIPERYLYEIYPGEGHSICYSMNGSVWSYDIDTKTKTELLNWMNSDVNPNRVSNILPISGNRFLITEYSYNYDSMKVAVMSPVSAENAVEKYVVKLACNYLDEAITNAIIDFNKQNAEYRIQVVDYSQYNTDEDYTAGVTKLNNDIITGKSFDLILMNQLSYESFASKGLLADIGAMMESDETFQRDKYLTNILDAASYGGKIYSVIPLFDISTVIAKRENVGDRISWTMDDLKALMQKYPDAAVFSQTERGTVLNYFASMAMGQ